MTASILGPMGRGTARVWAGLLTAAVAVVDVGPPWLRFGIGRSVRNRLLNRPLPSLRAEAPADGPRPEGDSSSGRPVVLVTRSLGTGGVEAIVATLARHLPAHGVAVTVLAETLGSTADALRADGVRVVEARDETTALDVLATLPDDTVVELHNAPDHLVAACRERGLELVSVIHTTDINLGPEQWAKEAATAELCRVSIAVSDTVRAFYLHHLPRVPSSPVVVIHNGSDHGRNRLDPAVVRASLGEAVGTDLRGAVVLSCLARYDLQKNLPGLVASFLLAAERRPDLHLVVAGPAEDWIEHALAKALCRSHPAGDRVHLMGTCSAPAILAASDAFILDSFFEGWPVAATEAVLSGLPLLISEVGGAAELVGSNGERGRIYDNPGGAPEAISLSEIQRARRRPERQRNRVQLARAVLEICAEIDVWRARRAELATAAGTWLNASRMAGEHARVLLAVGSSKDTVR
jgi:glycosyltransferase involved in cell wall biosynthesis